jgi:hypothetical protein
MNKFYKVLFLLLGSFLIVSNVYGQKSQGIGTDKPNSRAVIDITVEQPTTFPQGLLLPRLTTVQRNSLATVAGLPAGMAVFDSNDLKFYIWSGSWVAAGSSNLTTITGTNVATVTTITGGYNIDVPYISIVGINGLVVTSVGTSFSVGGQNITSSQWTTTGNNIYYDRGNVSIGLTSSGAALTILQDAGVKPALQLLGGVTKSVFLELGRGSSDATIGVAGNVSTIISGLAQPGDLVIKANAFNSSLILSAKNAGGNITLSTGLADNIMMFISTSVGIGTSIPSAMLDVNGNARIRNLSVSGSILTVDGLGNVGMGTIAASPSYFTFSGSNIRTLNNTDNIQLVSTTGSYLIGTNNALRMNDGYSVFIGNSGNITTTGSFNIFMGLNAGANISTGTSNNFFGVNAGNSNTGGNNNNFIGASAGIANTSGGDNNFIGYSTGSNNTIGSYNVFFGSLTGNYNTTGSYNNFYGFESGFNNTTGNGNIFIGSTSGINNSTGNNNIAIGTNSAFSSSNYSNAIVLGSNATATGSNQIVMGSNITGLGINTAPTAMLDVNGGTRIRNLSISGSVLTVDGLGNLGMGTIVASTQYLTINGTNLQPIGSTDFNIISTGVYRIGNNIAMRLVPANSSVYVGSNTASTSSRSVVLGYQAGLTEFGDNVYIGNQAGQNSSAVGGVYIGSKVAINDNGNQNVYIGYQSGGVSSGSNVAVGANAGSGLSGSASQNVIIGNSAGNNSNPISSPNNVLIGYNSQVTNTNVNNSIALGANVSVGANNQVIIGSAITGLGINIAPTAMLDVNGGIRVRNLNTSGSVLTVDGLGNVGMGTIAASANYWSLTGSNYITTAPVTAVGIGTTSPGSALEVYASSLGGISLKGSTSSNPVAYKLGFNGAGYNGYVGIVNGANDWGASGFGLAGDMVIGSGSGGKLIFGYGSSPAMIQNGNLGLGGTYPSATLDVKGTVRFENLSVTGSVLTVDGFGNVGMGIISSGASQWTTTTSGIYSNTFVGIGNINPANLLSVQDVYLSSGGSNYTSSKFDITHNAPNAINKAFQLNYSTLGTGGTMQFTGIEVNMIGRPNVTPFDYVPAYSAIFGVTGSGNMIGFQSSVGGANTGKKIGFDANVQGTGGTQNIGINITVSGATNNYAALLNGGNVGIGTLTPNQSLAIVGNSSVTGTGYFGALQIQNLSVSGSVLTVDGLGNVGMATISSSASQWITTTTGIYSNTFVGIGNSNPTSPLSVQDFFNSFGGRISAKFDITHRTPNASNQAIQLNYSMAGTGGTMQFTGIEANMNGNPNVTAFSNVPAFSAIFNTSGNGNMVGFQASIAGTSLVKKTGFDANVQGTGGTQNIGLNVTVSGATNNYAALLNGGNVGIGTLTPNQSLAIVGNSSVSGIGYANTIIGNNIIGIGVNTFTGNEALRIGGLNPGNPKGMVFPYVTTAQMVTLTTQLGAMDMGMAFYSTDYKNVVMWDGTQWSNTGNNGSFTGSSFNNNWTIYGGNTISGTGMSVAGFARLGTADNYGLMFSTNNNSRIYIPANTLAGVMVGFGNNSTTLTSTFSVNGDIGIGNGNQTGNGQIVIWLTNTGSGANFGDIIVVGNADDSFSRSTTASDNSAIGVLAENCPTGNICKVAIAGVVTVNITGGVVRGQHCVTSITAGNAQSVAIPNPGSSIGVFLQTTAGTSARVLLR